MAKRGLSIIQMNGVRKSLDWNGEDKYYAEKAVKLFEQQAEENAKPKRRFMATLIRRVLNKPKPN